MCNYGSRFQWARLRRSRHWRWEMEIDWEMGVCNYGIVGLSRRRVVVVARVKIWGRRRIIWGCGYVLSVMLILNFSHWFQWLRWFLFICVFCCVPDPAPFYYDVLPIKHWENQCLVIKPARELHWHRLAGVELHQHRLSRWLYFSYWLHLSSKYRRFCYVSVTYQQSYFEVEHALIPKSFILFFSLTVNTSRI